MAKPPRIAAVTNSLAAATLFCTVLPCAKLAAIAEAKIQPVPWVFFVSMRSTWNSAKSRPSKSTSRMEDQTATDLVRAPEMLQLFAGDPFFERAQEINELIARRAYELFESRGFM